MKSAFASLILGALPLVTLAAGGHADGHGHHAGTDHNVSAVSESSAVIGRPGDLARVDRSVEVVMDDTMRFIPGDVKVKSGETVRFVVTNAGKSPHEMVIGTLADLRAHAAEMRKSSAMTHAEPNMIVLEGGQRGELIWQFDTAGTVDFACLIPGHMEAGMIGKVRVERP